MDRKGRVFEGGRVVQSPSGDTQIGPNNEGTGSVCYFRAEGGDSKVW
jgi:hypothetical protein